MLTAMGDVMRECYKRGWITTRDGNISLVRKNGNYLYITPSGFRKTIIHPEHIIKLDLIERDNGGRKLWVPDGKNPSGELQMHWLIQENAKGTRAVVHVHPTHVIAAIYRGFNIQKICADFPEIYRYTKVGPSVPALPATSKELAEATIQCLGVDKNGDLKYDIVGQANHGVCAVAKDPWSAFEHIERLNHICDIVLSSGVDPE